MNVEFETIIKIYDEEISRLTKENLFLKAHAKQLEINTKKENQKPQE